MDLARDFVDCRILDAKLESKNTLGEIIVRCAECVV
jgi:hypothetical protein